MAGQDSRRRIDLAFVDTPLVVDIPAGQRSCERAVGRRYDRWKVSANSTNQSSDAPQTNCYLVTKTGKPGYGLYAYYGAAAKDFLTSERSHLEKGYGPTGSDQDYAWATATCLQSAQSAVFVLYHLYDRDTDSYPVPHYSMSFAAFALKAFADHETTQRGCTAVQMMSRA